MGLTLLIPTKIEHRVEYLKEILINIQIERKEIHINQLKNRTSRGSGGINAELLKYGTLKIWHFYKKH